MSVTTRGFHGREADSVHQLPPGQYETRSFPSGIRGVGPAERTWLGLSGSESWRLPVFAVK